MPIPSSPVLRWTVQITVGGMGLLLLLLAFSMDQSWADRHMLPDILVASGWLTAILWIERIILALIGALLLLLSPRLGRMIKAGRGNVAMRWMAIGLAILLAVPASEGAIRLASGRAGQSWSRVNEPLRRADPVIGWTNIPARRAIDPDYPSRPVYVIDSHGYRVAAESRALDTAAPSILFVGESVMFGKGLNWRDSVAGQVEALSGLQSVNLAVPAFSAGQGFLHLRRELPRFKHPRAVIILFGPDLLVRDLDRSRPWIDQAGQWHAAAWSWHLGHVGRVLFPYHRASTIDAVVASDRRILAMDVALARRHGADPLVVVPVFQPERRQERALRQAIFGNTAIPHVLVPLDPDWRLFPDFHPDARAHAAMARAIWGRLKGRSGSDQ
ncbi:hypothetical protein [Sphingobium sp.]|uniref:hypothetical protein n=1 Tax=Sphingobium sp. TaxID=1912891 RepID=UPI0028BE376E|nr:hypothetical protein [Sphingobium sp.]